MVVAASSCWAKKTEPSIASSTSGVSMCRVPIFDALGQPSPGRELSVSRARSAGVQTPRPSPIEGLIVSPSGRVTTAFLTVDSAIPVGLSMPSSWKSTEKSRPLPVSAEAVLGSEPIVGAKSSREQPVGASGLGGSASSWTEIVSLNHCGGSGFCQESASTPKVSGEAQLVGSVRVGSSGIEIGQPSRAHSSLRSKSWEGAAGLPQMVSLEERKKATWVTLATLARML